MHRFAFLAAAGAAMLAAIAAFTYRRRSDGDEVVVPTTMRAVVVRDGECVVISDWPTPTPAAGEILVRVVSTAVNRLDLLQRLGKAPIPEGVTEVLGLECAGTVVRLGEGVRAFAIGDEVLALVSGGGYSEYVALPAETAMRKPTALSWEEAGSIPEAWLTAFKLVHVVGGVRPQEKVLIHAAASGVGVAAIQLTKDAGAIAFVTVGSQEKLQVCVDRLGAADGAVRHDGAWIEKLKASSLFNGSVHVVLDPVASSYAEQNLAALAIDGRWILYSALSGPALPEAVGKTYFGSMTRKRLSLLATTLRTRPLAYKEALVQRFAREVLPKLASGRLEHIIDRVFVGLEQAQAAHEYMESNANLGKIVLKLT